MVYKYVDYLILKRIEYCCNIDEKGFVNVYYNGYKKYLIFLNFVE